MSEAQLARYTCKYCNKAFDEGRQLGGHIRQSHPSGAKNQGAMKTNPSDGDLAASVLEMWRDGNDPYKIVTALRVHPAFIKGVLREYDELLNEWKKSTEAK